MHLPPLESILPLAGLFFGRNGGILIFVAFILFVIVILAIIFQRTQESAQTKRDFEAYASGEDDDMEGETLG